MKLKAKEGLGKLESKRLRDWIARQRNNKNLLKKVKMILTSKDPELINHIRESISVYYDFLLAKRNIRS